MIKYFSYSDLSVYSNCQEQHRLKHTPNVLPRGRGAAMVIGAAIHAAIRMLHRNPALDIPSLVCDQIDQQVANRPDVPVLWGEKQWSREGRTEKAIAITELYWLNNKHIEVLRSEVWFWFEIPTISPQPFWMRGKVDQIIRGENGNLIIREIKTGATDFKVEDLETDLQVPLQAFGIATGYIDTVDDRMYVGESDPSYHIHDWEASGDKFKCSHCEIVTERFGAFPEYMEFYNLMKLDAGKTEGKTKKSYGNPVVRIKIYEEHARKFIGDVAGMLANIRESESTGIYRPPVATGFNSPCRMCMYTAHCTKKTCVVEMT